MLCSLKICKISQSNLQFKFDLNVDINSSVATKDIQYLKFHSNSPSAYLFLINYQNLEAQ